MRFGEHLESHGLVSKQALLAALEVQRNTQKKVGQIAIQHSILTIRQVFEVLQVQADSKSKEDDERLFGELAIELGFMTVDELLFVIKTQLETRAPIGETLVALGALTNEQLEEQLQLFESSKTPS